jgi:hypothetical protein
MAYDEELAHRLRAELSGTDGVTEMAMFGGRAFLINGNMAVSASGQGGLLLRCDPAETEQLIADAHAHRFEMRGREMDGWLRVDAAGVTSDKALKRWVAVGAGYARSLPPKRA